MANTFYLGTTTVPGCKKSTKRELREESRRRMQIAARHRDAARIRAAIHDFESHIATIDAELRAELEKCAVRDPAHYTYPMAARALTARRENLTSTSTALKDRLAKIVQFLPQTSAA